MKDEPRHLRKLRHRGAVSRGHAGRARLPWKRALLLAFLLTGSFIASIGEENRAAFAEVLLDPLSLLAQRSPGERGAGALLRSKPDNVNLAALTGPFGPTERVLSAVRTRPPIEFGPDSALLGPIVPEIAQPDFAVPEALPITTPGVGVPGLPFIGPGPSLAGAPPAPGDGPTVPPEDETPEQPILPNPAIPEPATWLTMILGMLAVGGALRRRRAGKLDRHAAA